MKLHEISESADTLAHVALDIAGLIPGAGEAADLTNALWYARKGDYVYAVFSLISTIPEVGDLVGKGAKYLGTRNRYIQQLTTKFGPIIIKYWPKIKQMVWKTKEFKPYLRHLQAIVDKITNKQPITEDSGFKSGFSPRNTECTEEGYKLDGDKYISPDAIMHVSRENQSPIDNFYYRTFYYSTKHGLLQDSGNLYHTNLLDFNVPYVENTLNMFDDNNLFGRTRIYKGNFVITFWNRSEKAYTLLKDLIRAMDDEGIIPPELPIYTSTPLNGTRLLANIKTTEQAIDPEELAQERNIHTMQGDEKKKAMQKLGLATGGRLPHAIDVELQKLGLSAPGWKFRTLHSEEIQPRLNTRSSELLHITR